ncbi:hypothetical protein B0H21DRAFT_505179 [Amylocystis lapponica]|nr:hypothetical protein B0H21DRAFT_505179 [Amylocystis lapponica]
MLSLLSRLRGNKHRRTPERNPTPTEFREPAASTSVYFPTPRHALDRPIVANPADLLEPHERNDPVPRGLTPPRTPKRSVVERIPTDESDDLNGLADQQHTSTETQNHTMYSTFGRNNAYGTPTQVHQDSSTLSLTRNDHSVCSPSNTRSSQYNSAHSHQSRTQTQSSTTRSTHSIRSRSADRSVPRDSPYTFGKPSPSFRTRSPSGYFSASASLAEPLPSFSHPELISALSSRSQTRSRTFDSLSVRRSNHWIPPIHGNTYPPHRRNKTNDDTQDSNMLRRSLRAYASLPKNVFRTISSTPTELRRESSRPRTRTISNRRESAEWNAQQATTGVTSPRASEFGWPAEAAQEMVMLSIGEGTSRGRSANAEPRDPHARSESPGRCYPSRHIPSQSPPSFALLQEQRRQGYDLIS